MEQKLERLDRDLSDASVSPDILVAPELFQSDYCAGDLLPDHAAKADSFAEAVAKLAQKHQCCIVYGYPEHSDDSDKMYNSALAISSEGKVLANHRKLVPWESYEREWFGPGEHLTLFELNGWNVAIVICYDIEFAEIARACATKGANLIVAPTALTDEWDVVSERVVPTRAFENCVFTAYANHCGPDRDLNFLGGSCIVGPDGIDLARAGAEDAFLLAELSPDLLKEARQHSEYVELAPQIKIVNRG